MGNLYTDNLIGTVIGLSVADDWEGARREWEIVGCEVDETHSATCVCGKEGLRYVYTIANTETGETLSPIGSSCIKKFEQSDMDEELAGWQQAIKLMEEAARIGKEDYVHLHSGSYSRKLLYFLYEQDAFRPTKYNGLNAVDRDVIGLQVGVELSYLTVPEQEMVEEVHESTGKYPSLEQAKKIRQHREEKTLTKEIVRLLVIGERKKKTTVTLKQDEIKKYFPPEYDEQKIRTVICQLLEEWSNQNH